MYAVGRALQFTGLVIMPLSVLMQVQNSLTLWQSLAFSGFGILLFTTGYLLQGMKLR